MDGALIARMETTAEVGASTLFAAAVGFAAYSLAGAAGLQSQLGLAGAAAGALAYLPCSRLLAAVERRGPLFPLPEFGVRDFDFAPARDELLLTERVTPDELLLTERLTPDELLLTGRLTPDELLLTGADRFETAAPSPQTSPLVLDDILAEMGPEAGVVRLFDRKAIQTPGQLQSRIADHLEGGAPPFAPSQRPAPSDASEALSEALAELRRSLR